MDWLFGPLLLAINQEEGGNGILLWIFIIDAYLKYLAPRPRKPWWDMYPNYIGYQHSFLFKQGLCEFLARLPAQLRMLQVLRAVHVFTFR